MHTLSKNPLRIALAAAVFAWGAVSAFAQTVKVGVVNTYSGPTNVVAGGLKVPGEVGPVDGEVEEVTQAPVRPEAEPRPGLRGKVAVQEAWVPLQVL